MSLFTESKVGEFSQTKGRTLTETDLMNFAGISGDFNYLHTDAKRMEESEFGERIVHGALVFSVMTGLLWQSRSEEDQDAVVAFYGIDRLRFVKPVFLGDTIHVESEVIETEQREHPVANGLIRYDLQVKNQHEDVVLACEFLSLVT
ncbi:MaoC/PaaZ C-terminal domain-containing protein [Halalkalicoccus jeotgali]|uniref:Monoamine oxidase regulatory protein n=1 Tax=Halalkalicoccus jeotgali (strain DSM 18796 / CECT 7217 / JCM 14584 / KCTC 4019 / B3) TaxID=795797 RepID=D8JBF6_HALJB|nr:MaoC/PaaZ C-terminal domain-containing protein [Halalkalicoccus jeotgali]ADJ16609.1 monoamine oxidase regulatory protein [Halalkalicoccus jeotgali B3]ELY41294.1 monoamine oxidase regulatory protein [Halalkalicoccus jeotgali B3]